MKSFTTEATLNRFFEMHPTWTFVEDQHSTNGLGWEVFEHFPASAERTTEFKVDGFGRLIELLWCGQDLEAVIVDGVAVFNGASANKHRLEWDRRHPHPLPENAPCFECKHYDCEKCSSPYEAWELYE